VERIRAIYSEWDQPTRMVLIVSMDLKMQIERHQLMIQIEHLSKSFGDLRVLEDVSIHIPKGKIHGLIGHSGVGKSTLLRCINGLEKYDSGNLIVDGINIKELTETEARKFKRSVGMIFQNFSLLNRLSVYENIALPMRCWKYGKNAIDKRVKELLELVEISDKINVRQHELSGGQKQRVAIARALAMNPKIKFCYVMRLHLHYIQKLPVQ